ncbi:MAG: hypothetical protein AAB410_03680 [Patescibacteria group bacterium]
MRTTLQEQKIISSFLIAIVAYGGFEIVAYILNLNEPVLFIKAAFAIWLYLAFKITFLYDLHFKEPGALERSKKRHGAVSDRALRVISTALSAVSDRFSHLLKKHHWAQFQNYLILPGMLFWGTVILLYVDMGNTKLQQILIFLSGSALVVNYWYLKEVFFRKTEKLDPDIFSGLGAVKIYVSAIIFAASLAIMRRFCLEHWYFLAAVFSLTYLLAHQALFQHRLVYLRSMGWVLLLSAMQTLLAYFIYRYWGYNYFTAGVVMTAVYNLMWGTLHYHLDKALTKKAFFEMLLICLIVSAMLISVTNFKARLLDGCIF